MRAYAILGGVVAALLLVIGAFMFGRSSGIEHQLAVDAKVMRAATARMEKARAAIEGLRAEAGRRDDKRRETVREIYREVPAIIDRPVYRSDCVDADGVRLLDRAAATANGEDRPGAAQPAAAPAPPGS